MATQNTNKIKIMLTKDWIQLKHAKISIRPGSNANE